ncbi:MAG: hypothetical protein EP344_15390 [Bacteroidetes bacterium]|nr:MAG: hypothetical protein EP344_15390 [Bacteroidota bacterium]
MPFHKQDVSFLHPNVEQKQKAHYQRASCNKQNQLKKPTFCFILIPMGIFSLSNTPKTGTLLKTLPAVLKKITMSTAIILAYFSLRWSGWLTGLFWLLFLPTSMAQQQCHAEEIARRNLERSPWLQDTRAAANQIIRNAPLSIVAGRTIVEIPVVIHVVFKGSLENISEGQILSQMKVLNADYRRLNADTSLTPLFFQPVAADMELQFCLAQTDPDGKPTSGITRTSTPWNNIGQLVAPDGRPRIHYSDLGGKDAWDPEHYLNIWVCQIGGGILGFGTYPGSAPLAEDGVVIDARYFGTTGLAAFYPPHHLGRTATHEIAHYFNLLHIWGPDEYSCADDDEVADTPGQRGPFLDCPAYPQFSCGNSVMFMNFLDYTNDACMSLFTEGQKVRLRAALFSTRSGLLDSNGCQSAPAGTSTTKRPKFMIAPNPAGTYTKIRLPEKPMAVIVRVTGLNGKLWLEQPVVPGVDTITLDCSQIPAGLYCITVVFSNTVANSLFIKGLK